MNELKAVAWACAALALLGCQSESARDQINSQNTADYNAKSLELQDAVGTWSGTMHLVSQDQDFDCVLTLGVVPQNERSPEVEAPSESVKIATLGGNLCFPALVNLPLEDYPGFQALFNPLDILSTVNISYGDYQKSDRSVALPYLDKNGSTFGNLSGKIQGNEVTGDWFANDFGNVGTFVLDRQSQAVGCQPAGGQQP